MSTAVINGVTEPYAALTEATKYGAPGTIFVSWRNLATGEVHGAVRCDSAVTGCAGDALYDDEARMGSFRSVLFSVRWDSGFRLKLSTSLPAGLLMSVSGGWGMSDTDTMYLAAGQVKGYPIDGLEGQPPFVLEKPSGARYGDADGDMMVWTDGPRLRGWAADGEGVRTIVQAFPAPLFTTAMSPARVLAVLGVDPAPQGWPLYTSLSFWWAPRAAEDVTGLGEVVDRRRRRTRCRDEALLHASRCRRRRTRCRPVP